MSVRTRRLSVKKMRRITERTPKQFYTQLLLGLVKQTVQAGRQVKMVLNLFLTHSLYFVSLFAHSLRLSPYRLISTLV